jgi:hypothetical protein
MKVAWHEVPGKIGKREPSRRDRMIVYKPLNGRSIDNSVVAKPIFVTDQQVAKSYRPYGTRTLRFATALLV